ncbi:MAG TPA: hypothetical protein P5532_09015 [Planctomycetota bacterium]|nr:hypothetical protein [Planctomycetota bacterium]
MSLIVRDALRCIASSALLACGPNRRRRSLTRILGQAPRHPCNRRPATQDRAGIAKGQAGESARFGTLFEQGLDPSKRSQLSAHYSSRDGTVTLVEPVVMQPLRREWAELRATLDSFLTTGKKPHAEAAEEAGKTAVCSAGFSPSSEVAEEKKRPEGRIANAKPLRGPSLRTARDAAIALVNRFRLRLGELPLCDSATTQGPRGVRHHLRSGDEQRGDPRETPGPEP